MTTSPPTPARLRARASGQLGAASAEYVAAVLVLAALVAVVIGLAIPERTEDAGAVAVGCLFDEACPDLADVASDGSSSSSSSSGGSAGSSSSVSGGDGTGSAAADGTAVGAAEGEDAGDPPPGEDGPDPDVRLDPDEVLDGYQVDPDPDGLVSYPSALLSWIRTPLDITAEEARMLDDLGLLGQKDFLDIRNEAYDESDARYDVSKGAEDGHQDAMRHAYWNALMVGRFGLEWTERFATAHERIPGNPADKEAMDLYNNEVGRQIAVDNPDASTEELAELVMQAIADGEMVVIDADGELAYSDEVEPGQTGDADDPQRDDGDGVDLPGDDESTTGGGYDPQDPDDSGPRSDP